MPKQVTFAVLSDIHAFERTERTEGNPPSLVCTSDVEPSMLRDPFRGLEDLIERYQLKADAILCPGDLGDKAMPGPIAYVWRELQNLKVRLGAHDVIATAGNHDFDSRDQSPQFNPREILQRLVPKFPGLDVQSCDRYWAREYVIAERETWRILLLNSVAYHGYSAQGQPEHRHGRISSRTLEQIHAELRDADHNKLNVLMTHHHLTRNNPLGDADYSEMQGGDRLLDMLDSGEIGEWFVIHGHKHHPRIFYAAGGMTSPVILASGSFSATLWHELARIAQNQFYLLEFDLDEVARLRLGVAGSIRAWDWITSRGWQPATVASGIPRVAGFGYRCSTTELLMRIRQLIDDEGRPFLAWEELVEKEPRFKYLLPFDLGKLKKAIEKDPQLGVIGEHETPIAQVSKAR